MPFFHKVILNITPVNALYKMVYHISEHHVVTEDGNTWYLLALDLSKMQEAFRLSLNSIEQHSSTTMQRRSTTGAVSSARRHLQRMSTWKMYPNSVAILWRHNRAMER